MSASIGDWGDLTNEREKNVQHNAREAQLDRKEREESNDTSGVGRRGRPASRRGPMRDVINVPIFGPAEQYEMSQGALNATMDNIRRENDSRVSQRREMRRLGADYEMERLRQQGANYRANVDAEAQLIRQLLADM